jgi:hypothetical protein
MCLAKVAHLTSKTRPIHELAGLKIVQVAADQAEQPAKMRIRSGGKGVHLDLRNLGLHQTTDLQIIFALASGRAISVTDNVKNRKQGSPIERTMIVEPAPIESAP